MILKRTKCGNGYLSIYFFGILVGWKIKIRDVKRAYIEIAIQRRNAASVMGTFAPGVARGGLFEKDIVIIIL